MHLCISAVPSQQQIRTLYGRVVPMYTFKENTSVPFTSGKVKVVKKLNQEPNIQCERVIFFQKKIFFFKFPLKWSYRFSLIIFYYKKKKKISNSVHWI